MIGIRSSKRHYSYTKLKRGKYVYDWNCGPILWKKPISYDAWEATAVTNDTIDFYIFTDIPEIKDNKNIRVITCTFEECRQMIQKVMNFKISLESPYKLCDYKPTYGLVFHNWLKDYDFWGYCDLDVVFWEFERIFHR